MEISKWKQSKEITGISLSSIVDFKAAIAQEKQEILSGRPNKIRKLDNEESKNKGVHLRAQKDKVEKDLQEIQWDQAKLRAKAELYERCSTSGRQDIDDENRLVDFEQKKWDQEDEEKFPTKINNDNHYGDEENPQAAADEEREYYRRKWEEESRQEEQNESNKRFERRMLLNQIISETQEGRDKATQLQNERLKRQQERKTQIQKQAEIQKQRMLTEKNERETQRVEAERKKSESLVEAKNKRLNLKKT
jgi:hypothetical protein